MSPMRSLRLQVSLTVFVLVLLTAALALLLPESLRLLGAIAGSVVIGVAGALFVWWRLRSLGQLSRYAIDIKDGREGSEPRISGSEILPILQVIKELTDARSNAIEAHRETLISWQKVLQQFQDPNCPPSVAMNLETPFIEEQNQVIHLVDEFGKQLFAIRQRMALAMRVLNQLPDGVAALDGRGVCRYMNAALERLLGLKQQGQWQRQPFVRFVAEELPADQPWHDPAVEPLPAGRLNSWLEQIKGGSCSTYLKTDSKELIPAELVVSAPGQGEGLSALVVHDLRPTRKLLAERLASDRMQNFGNFIKNYIGEVEPAVAKVISQGRLLLAEVKQTPQRTALVPKMQTLLSEASQLESIQLLNRFLHFLNEGELPAAVKTEFELGDVARVVKDRLAPLMRARNVSLDIEDRAGWLYGDEDRVTAILVGMLYHATRASQDQELTLKLLRTSEVAPDGSTFLEATLSPAGPLLNPEHLALLREPFSGWEARNLWSFDGVEGSPIGLLVAERLAAEAGGELDLRASSGGRLIVVLRLPSRLPDAREYRGQEDEEIAQLALAETCGSWRLGGADGSGDRKP